MRILVKKRLLLPQVERQLKRLEGKHRISSENLGLLFDKVQSGEVPMEEYLLWARLYDAYRAYVENGELDYVYVEELPWSARFISALTPRRLELLGHIAREPMESINDLARRVGRDVKNVHGDLKILSSLGLVLLSAVGNAITAQALVDEITLVVR